jgi:metal-responsive CopG/Arc/MetJ family transcriptional regulator
MKASRKNVVRKKRGRQATGQDPVTAIRLSSQLRKKVDVWAAKQPKEPSRSQAIRQLVELGLASAQGARARGKNVAKASEMAGQEIDRLADQSATAEEQQLRKRRLIKGPKEFRDMRSNRQRAEE